MLPLIVLLLFTIGFAQKIYVVERERGALAVIEEGKVKEIKNLGNTNHATLKFWRGHAYLISRDGFLSRIDTRRDRLVKKVRVGKSSIGFTFCLDKVAVANYSPKDVVLLSEDLEELRRIETGSKNVGIKSYRGLLVFSLMDKDEVWIVDCKSMKLLKRIRNVGSMPFDALLSKDKYIVGLFGENAVGVLDLKDFSYRKVRFGRKGKEVVFKVPHFGLWGVWKDKAYIPAVGERKVHVVDLESFEYIGSINLPGLPVFVSVSPDGRYLAVNYSGDSEDLISLIDREKMEVVRTRKLGRRILHLRFSLDGSSLYLSSYYENLLKRVSVPGLELIDSISVPTPSGVFIEGG